MPAPYTYFNIINGHYWNETINGTANADAIYGQGGNDILYGLEGDDYLNGGLGNDWLFGGLGNDTFDGGAGNNIFFGNSGTDTVTYKSSQYGVHINLAFGETTNSSNSNQDDLYNIENAIGSDFEDYIQGDDEINALSGGFSNDVLNGWNGNDILDGGYHDDLMIGGEGDDTFIGGHGADRHFGGNGIDTVDYSASTFGISMAFTSSWGGGGNAAGDRYFNVENITGSQGNDVLEGDDNANRFVGNAGEDILVGRGGKDQLIGGIGQDTIYGGSEDDAINGDLAFASLAFLSGGDDFLFGNEGDDFIYGGKGKDTMTGGSGRDKFAYTSSANSGTTTATRDFITDFNDDWDVIALNAIDARAGTSGNEAFTFIGRNSFSGAAGQLRYSYSGGDTIISGDTNGDRNADFQITLDDYISLRATDFIL